MIVSNQNAREIEGLAPLDVVKEDVESVATTSVVDFTEHSPVGHAEIGPSALSRTGSERVLRLY